jgi:hypothetical protein
MALAVFMVVALAVYRSLAWLTGHACSLAGSRGRRILQLSFGWVNG